MLHYNKQAQSNQIVLNTVTIKLFIALFFFILAWFTFRTHTVHAQEPDSDKSGVWPQVISLPSGPGSLEGIGESFEPDLSTATASYPLNLEVPPGRVGFEPHLTLSYNGGNGNLI